MFIIMQYTEYLVPTLTVLSSVYAYISTFVLFSVVTGPITRFPLLQADLSTHIEALILCAEVRGYSRSAVLIAETILTIDKTTRTVQLSAAKQPFLIPIIHTGHVSITFINEGEDAGTAGVRSRHCVAAGAMI